MMSRRMIGCGVVAVIALLAAFMPSAARAAAPESAVSWRALPAIPEPLVVSEVFAGVADGKLIVAGGANFPGKPPWEGGAKVWTDRILVLDRPDGTWRVAEEKLPRPMSRGVSITTDRGLLCIGGGAGGHTDSAVFLLTLEAGHVKRTPMPSLPVPLAGACGAKVGPVIYVVGGGDPLETAPATNRAWAMDLSVPRPAWREIAPLPGPGRVLAVAGVQGDSLLVFSGAELIKNGTGKLKRKYLRDAYRYRPGAGWTRLADVPRAAVAAPSPAPAAGPTHVLVLGGDDGSHAGFTPAEDHPGFCRDVLGYDAITNTWAVLGAVEVAAVATPCVSWVGGMVVAGGEVRPGVRTGAVMRGQMTDRRSGFGWLNYTALVVYLLAMVGVGFVFSKQSGTDSFFRGGQRVPWWAAALSIYATMLSAITYMAVPAKTFATDWGYLLTYAGVLAVAPLVVWAYLPFFRQLDVTSAYEYLEKRFNIVVRLLGSGAFIVLQLGRIAIVLCLPAMALATVSSIDIYSCILLMGLLCVIYTVVGGIEAVIWADVVQAIVLLLGALVTLVVIVSRCDGGLLGIVRVASDDGKLFRHVPWNASMAEATGWVLLVGGFFSSMIPYTASQDIVQRYVTTPDPRRAARSIWANAMISVPSGVLFFALGTALYAYYKLNPTRLDPALPTDAIFPLFIVRELPAGVGGLVVAGIFAAAQSTLSGGLNSVATCIVTDFVRRLGRVRDDRAHLRLARWITVVLGVLGTLGACGVASLGLASLWDGFLGLIGLTGGGLAGLFALGIFTRRANASGALIGFLASTGLLLYLQAETRLHFMLYAMVGVVSCFVIGYVASVVSGGAPGELTGLTLWTRRSPRHEIIELIK